MPITLRPIAWEGAGYTLPAALPGSLEQALHLGGLLADPANGLDSQRNEWATQRPFTLLLQGDVSRLRAERVFLRACGVGGRGRLFIDGRDAGPFSPGDWERDITAHVAGKGTCAFSLRFDPTPPEGLPLRPFAGVEGGLWLCGVSQLKIKALGVVPLAAGNHGTLTLRPRVIPYVPGRYVFSYAITQGGETLAKKDITETLPAAPMGLAHQLILPVKAPFVPGVANVPIRLRLTVKKAGITCDDVLLHTGFRPEGDGPFLVMADVGKWSGRYAAAGTIREELARLAQVGINALRVFGLRTPAFYDALCAMGFFLVQMLPGEPEEALAIMRAVGHLPALYAYGPEDPEERFRLAPLVKAQDESHPLWDAPAPYGLPCLLRRDIRPDCATVQVHFPAMPLAPEALFMPPPYWPPGGPLWAHRAAETPDLSPLEDATGDALPDPRIALPLLRSLQAETTRHALLHQRLGKKAGAIVGTAFSGIPSLCGHDLYDGNMPRPAAHALFAATRPILPWARLRRITYGCGQVLETALHLLLDAPLPGPLALSATLYGPDGQPLHHLKADAPTDGKPAGIFRTLLPQEPGLYLLRVSVLRLGEIIASCDHALCVSDGKPLSPLLSLPAAVVAYDEGRLTNRGRTIAFFLCYEGEGPQEKAIPAFTALLPGESRTCRQENSMEGLNVTHGENWQPFPPALLGQRKDVTIPLEPIDGRSFRPVAGSIHQAAAPAPHDHGGCPGYIRLQPGQ